MSLEWVQRRHDKTQYCPLYFMMLWKLLFTIIAATTSLLGVPSHRSKKLLVLLQLPPMTALAHTFILGNNRQQRVAFILHDIDEGCQRNPQNPATIFNKSVNCSVVEVNQKASFVSDNSLDRGITYGVHVAVTTTIFSRRSSRSRTTHHPQ